MNKAMILFAGALATLSMVGPAFATSASSATQAPSKTTSAPAATSATHKVAAMRHVTGEVVSANQDAETLTVKHGTKGKALTFAVDANAAQQLGGLKPGDQVKISYVKSAKQLMAKQITKSEVAKAK